LLTKVQAREKSALAPKRPRDAPHQLVAHPVGRSPFSLAETLVKTDILDRGPDNRQATGFCREHVNLVGALSHIAKETFDGVGRLNVTMHALRKRIKCQHMLLVLSQTAYRFWIALSILGW